MDFFELTICNCIAVTFPILIYFIYLIYNYQFDKKANDIILDICLITSYYLCFKIQSDSLVNFPYFIISLPLLIAYLKDKQSAIILLSFFPTLYFYLTYNEGLVIFFVEKIILYILYKIIKDKSKFTISFLIVRASSVMIFFRFVALKEFSTVYVLKYILVLVIGVAITYIIIAIFKKNDKIMKLYMDFNDLKKEKQIKESLFKITHEIKNPIAVCKGYLDMYDVENIDHSKKYIPIIKSEIERTLVLLQDFLCLRKLKIDKDIMDLTILLEETLDEITLYEEIKKVSYIKKYNVDDEILIEGDYNRLKQVLVNIIKNSIEALEDNKGIIIVKMQVKKNIVNLSIIDNGLGMSQEMLNKIKEPFFTTKIKGTGLGVPLSYEIIESHGFTIDYTSKLYEGTTVSITMPTYKKSKINSR